MCINVKAASTLNYKQLGTKIKNIGPVAKFWVSAGLNWPAELRSRSKIFGIHL